MQQVKENVTSNGKVMATHNKASSNGTVTSQGIMF